MLSTLKCRGRTVGRVGDHKLLVATWPTVLEDLEGHAAIAFAKEAAAWFSDAAVELQTDLDRRRVSTLTESEAHDMISRGWQWSGPEACWRRAPSEQAITDEKAAEYLSLVAARRRTQNVIDSNYLALDGLAGAIAELLRVA